MSDERERFLNAVRSAVREGNHAGGAPPLPERGGVGYQGAGDDPVARLRQELTAAGGALTGPGEAVIGPASLFAFGLCVVGAAVLIEGAGQLAKAALDQQKGDIEPIVLDGRAPRAANEVALGVRTLRDAHLHIGSTGHTTL